jgi:hypothetical protein
MPRIHWKPILAVFAIAVGMRGALKLREAEEKSATPPALAQVEEEEPVEAPEPAAGGAPEDAASKDTPPAHAPLAFDRDPIEMKPRPEDDEITATFEFTNTSGRPVTIRGLESTCSCLEASLDERTYAPGAKGGGEAVFKVSSFVGRHEKALHIFTDDPAAPEQVLTFILDVPVVVSIEPNLLEWATGDAPEPKTMVIKMVGEDPMRITKLTPTRENVRYALKEVTPGREYPLPVTPMSTADVTIGAFKIETDSKIPKYARQMAFFSITRPELAEKKKAAGGGGER